MSTSEEVRRAEAVLRATEVALHKYVERPDDQANLDEHQRLLRDLREAIDQYARLVAELKKEPHS